MSQQESPIIGFARNYAFSLWPWYLSGISALAVTNWLTLKIPQFAKDIVNQLSTDSPTEGLQRTALLMVGLGLLQAAGNTQQPHNTAIRAVRSGLGPLKRCGGT